jgi:hypothetical protein
MSGQDSWTLILSASFFISCRSGSSLPSTANATKPLAENF